MVWRSLCSNRRGEGWVVRETLAFQPWTNQGSLRNKQSYFELSCCFYHMSICYKGLEELFPAFVDVISALPNNDWVTMMHSQYNTFVAPSGFLLITKQSTILCSPPLPIYPHPAPIFPILHHPLTHTQTLKLELQIQPSLLKAFSNSTTTSQNHSPPQPYTSSDPFLQHQDVT